MQYASELSTVSLEDIKEMAREVRGKVKNVFLHWSAGRYGQIYPDYHISIDYDGRIYLPDNCRDLSQYRVHTYERNSNSIGIAVCGCYDASANNGYNCNLGSEPVTEAQIEAMAAVVACICKEAWVSVDNVLTHCEAAQRHRPPYGPYSGDPETRWDLWYLKDYDGCMKPGGEVLRGKARWYLMNGI